MILINNLTNSATQQEQFDSGNELEEAALSSEDEDQDEAVDFVVAEIGSSSSEEEEESDENDYNNCLSHSYLYKIREESNTLSVMNRTK